MEKKQLMGIDYTGICAVFLCHDGQGEFVMARRSANARDEQGKWDIGGGGLKFNENIEDCLVREVKEEYCADIVEHEFLGYRDVHPVLEGAKPHWVALDFIVQVNRAQVAIGDPLKMDEINWFNLENVPSYDHRHSGAPLFWELHLPKFVSKFTGIKQSA